MGETVEVSFQSLNIDVGATVQLVPDLNNVKALFEVVYIGALMNEALIVNAPPSGEFPEVAVGQKILVRVLMAEGVAMFYTTVLFISDVPVFMVYLDFPEVVKFHKIRKAKRASVNMPVLISGETEGSPRNIDGRIVDISTNGAGVETANGFADVGNIIQVKGKFKVGDIQRLLAIRAVIRARKASKNNKTFYGVEFIEDNEDDLLILFGFIFNIMAFSEIQGVK